MNSLPKCSSHLALHVRQRGLSLVELMVSLLISTIILFLLTQVLVNNRTISRSDEGLARLQENARFAMDFLIRDLRQAGSMGCLSLDDLRNSDAQGDPLRINLTGMPMNLADIDKAVVGHDATDITPSMSAYTLPSLYPTPLTGATDPPMDIALAPPGGIAQASDAVVIRSMDQDAFNLMGPATTNTYLVPGSANIAAGQYVMVTDCKRINFNRVLNANVGGGVMTLTVNPSPAGADLINQYAGQISSMRTVVYYVARGANNGPALFSRNLGDFVGAPQELVEGIENLQFLYGVNGIYLPASRVTNWANVVSVQVAMLVSTSNLPGDTANAPRSTAETSDDTNTYTVQGVALTPNQDRRRRRVFETTVVLRGGVEVGL